MTFTWTGAGGPGLVERFTTWWNEVEQHTQTYDYGDYMLWHHGAGCESEYEERKRLGLDVDGHAFDMPAWLERQLHFENIVYVLAMRVRYNVGALWCRAFGHPDRCLQVEEDGAAVAWSCSCCGNGGQSWW